jgi:hypothetical protein
MDRKVKNRTHFRRQHTPKAGWQWHWTTKANNGETVAVGGEGYDELRGAVNGFFSTHGIDVEQASLASEFSKLEKFSDDHYVITQYERQRPNRIIK